MRLMACLYMPAIPSHVEDVAKVGTDLGCVRGASFDCLGRHVLVPDSDRDYISLSFVLPYVNQLNNPGP